MQFYQKVDKKIMKFNALLHMVNSLNINQDTICTYF